MDREERRRKRTSQGIDRMAFITGRIHSLDPDPYSVSTPNQEDDSSQDHHHANLETASDQRIKEVAIQISSDPTNLSKKPFSGIIFSSMTLKGVNTSIISSENMRAICSIVIAMLVVLLHVTSLWKISSLFTSIEGRVRWTQLGRGSEIAGDRISCASGDKGCVY